MKSRGNISRILPEVVKLIPRYIALIAGLALMASCNSSGCIDNKSSLPLAGFYSSSSEKIAVSSLTIGGVNAPNDTLLLNNTSASQIYLPFRSQNNESSFFIHYNFEGLDDDLFNDTITFSYTTIPYFASEECGAMYRYKIDNVKFTKKLIENVEVTDPLITNVDTERVKIYFKTAEDTEE